MYTAIGVNILKLALNLEVPMADTVRQYLVTFIRFSVCSFRTNYQNFLAVDDNGQDEIGKDKGFETTFKSAFK